MKDKRTKAELQAVLTHTQAELSMHAIALQCFANGEIDAQERARIPQDDTRFVFRLMRSTGAHGGIVAVTSCEGEGRPHTDIYWLDRIRAEVRDGTGYGSYLPLRAAMERLVIRADAIVNSQKAAQEAR